MVLHLPDSWLNCNLEMLVFEERGETRVPEKKPAEERRKTVNKINPHMALKQDFNLVSAVTTAPPLLKTFNL